MTHRFAEKAKRQIREKQGKVAKLARAKRDPEVEYEESLYRFSNGDYGVPTGALAEAIVSASVDVMPKHKALIRRNLFVEDDGFSKDPESRGLLRLHDTKGKPIKPTMREDVVRLAGMTRQADLRYRGGFSPGWRLTAQVRFDARALSVDQVAQLIQIAGESIGLCEGRPEKTLALRWGTFAITKLALYDGVEKKLKSA